jgi:Putative addiction module component
MTAIAKRLEQEIGQLPLEDMLVLHDHLVTSIHEKEDTEKLDPTFRAEILQRIKEIDSGKVTGVDAFEALKQM